MSRCRGETCLTRLSRPEGRAALRYSIVGLLPPRGRIDTDAQDPLASHDGIQAASAVPRPFMAGMVTTKPV